MHWKNFEISSEHIRRVAEEIEVLVKTKMISIEAACERVEANALCVSEAREAMCSFKEISDASWRFVLEKYSRLSLFEGNGYFSENGWTLELRKPIPLAQFCYGMDSDDLRAYFMNCFVVAFSGNDGGDVVGINLNKNENFGKIFFASSGESLGLAVPLIANSLPEWIKKTLENGPETVAYFFKDDFVDLGSVVPGVKEFRGIKGYFHM